MNSFISTILKTTLFTLFTSQLSLGIDLESDPIRIEYIESSSGNQVAMKPLTTDLNIVVTGDLAQATLKQTFVNPTKSNIEQLAYVFPLPWEGSVHGMSYEYNGKFHIAEILEKQEAQQIYDSLQQQGQQAALLTEESPSIFKQQFSNLGGLDTLKIEVILSMKVPKVNGKYELIFPTMVADRYGSSFGSENGWNPPDSISSENLNIRLLVMSHLGIKKVSSPTHDLIFNSDFAKDDRIYSKGFLKEGLQIHYNSCWGLWSQSIKTFPNKDLVVRWDNERKGIEYQLNTWKSPMNDTGFFVLDILPDIEHRSKDRSPVELIILMDRSGSQGGWPLEYQKEIANSLLDQLENDDHIQFIDFSDQYNFYWGTPVNANSQNIIDLKNYMDGIYASGGTNLYSAIQATLDQPLRGSNRIYAFLTDGFISNETAIFELLENTDQPLQVFTFGSGNNINRFFLDRAAAIGDGFSTVVVNGEDPVQYAEEAWSKISGPQLSDISFRLKKFELKGIEKPRSNVLYNKNSYTATGKLIGNGLDTLILSGLKDGQAWSDQQEVNIRTNNPLSWVIPKIWARKKIERLYLTQSPYFEDHKDRIIEVSLKYDVLSPYTAFLAYEGEALNELDDFHNGAYSLANLENADAQQNPFQFDLQLELDIHAHNITIRWDDLEQIDYLSIFDLRGKLLKMVPASQLENASVKWQSPYATAQNYFIQIIGPQGVEHRKVFF